MKETRPITRWLPLLFAASGARVGEMAQLRAEDIIVQDGIHALRITSEAGSCRSMGSDGCCLRRRSPHILAATLAAVGPTRSVWPQIVDWDMPASRCVHYVGFKDDRYWHAYRIWGGPRVIHRRWDRIAKHDVGPDDVVIFAEGNEHQPLADYNATDIDERWLR